MTHPTVVSRPAMRVVTAMSATAALLLLTAARDSAGATAALTFWVAPEGSDENPGTHERPFASVVRARNAVRTSIAAGRRADVEVLLRGGPYRVAEAIVFGPGDGGTDDHAVTYSAAPGEKPILSGGRPIEGWRRASDGTLETTLPDAPFRYNSTDAEDIRKERNVVLDELPGGELERFRERTGPRGEHAGRTSD